jgi:hypothetical protein
MKKYQFYIYAVARHGVYCRMVFLIDDNDIEQFVVAKTKKNMLSDDVSMSRIEAQRFIKDNKLRLIDEFKIRM